MIVCGWCAVPTPLEACVSCHRDPTLPYVQRAQVPMPYDPKAEKRALLARTVRENPGATVEQIAELVGISPRSVRRWQADGRSLA